MRKCEGLPILSPGDQQKLVWRRKFATSTLQWFEAVSMRTVKESWKHDGVGSCYSRDKTIYEDVSDEYLDEWLIAFRETKNKKTPGASPACPYFRPGKGCILGPDKSVTCLSYIENPQEIHERFGQNPREITRFIRKALNEVMSGKANSEFVHKACKEMDKLRETVETYPSLQDDK